MNCVICGECARDPIQLAGGYFTVLCGNHKNKFHEHVMTCHSALYEERVSFEVDLEMAKEAKEPDKMKTALKGRKEVNNNFYRVSKAWVESEIAVVKKEQCELVEESLEQAP